MINSIISSSTVAVAAQRHKPCPGGHDDAEWVSPSIPCVKLVVHAVYSSGVWHASVRACGKRAPAASALRPATSGILHPVATRTVDPRNLTERTSCGVAIRDHQHVDLFQCTRSCSGVSVLTTRAKRDLVTYTVHLSSAETVHA